MKRLYKTTIVVWSEYNTNEVSLEDIGYAATSGDAYCSSAICALIENPRKDSDWDGTEFFGDDDDNELHDKAAADAAKGRRWMYPPVENDEGPFNYEDDVRQAGRGE